MIKLKQNRIIEEKDALNQEWDKLMANAENGILDRERAIYLMDRINTIDSFLIQQGI